MRRHDKLEGRYRIVHEALVREKAARTSDPRHIFYAALLAHGAYEAYLANVGARTLVPPGYKAGPISGRMEILYNRRNGWIRDVDLG